MRRSSKNRDELRSVDFPVPGARGRFHGGGLQDFLSFRAGFNSVFLGCAGRAVSRGFRNIPSEKTCALWPAGDCQSRRGLQLIHAEGSGRLLHGQCWQGVDQDLREHMGGRPGSAILAARSSKWCGAVLAQPGHSAFAAAPAVGTLSRAVAGGVRGQGLGIPWPLLGCPSRLQGRLKRPEYGQLGHGGLRPVVAVVYGGRGRVPHTFHAKLVFGHFFKEPVGRPGVLSSVSGCFWKNFTLLLFAVEIWTSFLRHLVFGWA